MTLSEDISAGVSILQVSAEDADSGTNGEIRYLFMTTANDFEVNPISGIISTRKPLQLSARDSLITILVSATDRGSPSQSNVVQVLIRINSNPKFTKARYDVKVREDALRGSLVETVNATGDNSEMNLGKINYTIINGDSFKNFRIGLRTGVIRVNRNLDYEKTQSYLLVVSATGDSSPPKTVTVTVNITVEDVNDNAPVFDEKNYAEELSEDVGVGTKVLTVSASDRDSGVGGEVRYFIQSGNDKGSFSINPRSGVLQTNTPLDHDSIKRYQLSVEAMDQGA